VSVSTGTARILRACHKFGKVEPLSVAVTYKREERTVNIPRRRLLRATMAVAALGSLPRAAWALTYPARPVRIIVPFGPGGNADVLGRMIAQKLSERLGQQFYVENVSGAGGNIGVGRAAQGAPDGYTILVTPPSYVINPALYGKVPYDARTSFDPVTLAVSTTIVLAVHPSVPARTFGELVAQIRTDPGRFNYATAGVGSPGHIVGEMLRQSLGLDLVHIPYDSAGSAIGSVVAGHTTICLAAPAPIVPQVRDGRLRALAVAYRTRLEALAETPTMAEFGYPDIVFDNWFGVFVPAGTQAEVVELLNREIVASTALPDVRARLVALGFDPVGSTPVAFRQQVDTELDKWTKVIRTANIKAQ
jgi:tripartite-type tricarboxylate transporter receptor subunit TctC